MIFEIEEFAIHDGPGIRKTVFLKGCPLRCAWCHNPESLSFHQELLFKKHLCVQCGRCREVCPAQAAPTPISNCITCGQCVTACPLRLRRLCGTEWEAQALAHELKKDQALLIKNGGGVTFSGGEPLAQPAFLLELIGALKPLHLALDTSGYAPPEVFKRILAQIDLVLFDVKHTDPRIHQAITGVDNRLILENLRFLCQGGKEFIIRIPLIPEINDTRTNLETIAALVKDAQGLQQVDFLPYHKTAGAKYPMLGKEYHPPFPVDQPPQIWHEVFQQHHIRSVVL